MEILVVLLLVRTTVVDVALVFLVAFVIVMIHWHKISTAQQGQAMATEEQMKREEQTIQTTAKIPMELEVNQRGNQIDSFVFFNNWSTHKTIKKPPEKYNDLKKK